MERSGSRGLSPGSWGRVGQLSCQGSAPCTTQVACGPRAPGRKAGLWPRVPAASGQEALSSSPPGHLGLCLFLRRPPASVTSACRQGQAASGAERAGGVAPGREAGDTSLRGPKPSCQPAGLHHHCCPAGASLGSPGRGLLCPGSPQASSVDTFPSTEEGGWLCPQRQSLQTVSKGWGFELGSPGSTGPSQPPSLQLV